MTYDRIVISSGHGKFVAGASGNPGLVEVEEARRVVEHLAHESSRPAAVAWLPFMTTPAAIRAPIRTPSSVSIQPSARRNVSVHFNAFEQTSKPRGVEVCYLTQGALASKVSPRSPVSD